MAIESSSQSEGFAIPSAVSDDGEWAPATFPGEPMTHLRLTQIFEHDGLNDACAGNCLLFAKGEMDTAKRNEHLDSLWGGYQNRGSLLRELWNECLRARGWAKIDSLEIPPMEVRAGDFVINPILIESHSEEGAEWLVSFDGPNPVEAKAVKCASQAEAMKLMELLGGGERRGIAKPTTPMHYAREPISEAFEIAICQGGTTCIDCDFCNRTHYAGISSMYSDDEYEELVEKAKKNPERYFAHAGCDTLTWGVVDNKQFVFDCPCNGARKYEDWIWLHRYVIAPYLKRRAADELKEAQSQVQSLDVGI